MATKLKFSTSAVTTDALVVGLAKSKNGLVIESGELKLDEKDLISALNDLGATAAPDEVIKLPGTSTKLIAFTGLGQVQKKYDHETMTKHLKTSCTESMPCPIRTSNG